MNTSAAPATRLEHDLLGEMDVPEDVYYGVHTARAIANFPFSGVLLASHPDFIRALATVKQAAAMANTELGFLDGRKAGAIIAACTEIREGRLHDHFQVDSIQGGAGTSTNMNTNEVIANRALELLGHCRGDYHKLHPLQDVNLSQSTNDVYPTAIKLALDAQTGRLIECITKLRESFAEKGLEFAGVAKMGRTQLQDAIPMTLGQEFTAYAVTLQEDEMRLAEARLLLHELNIGGTAIGTGLNAAPGYREQVLEKLRELSGISTLISAADLIEATQDAGVFVQLSGVLKRVAVKLSKICNDLRLLSSGPRAGFNEINLPPVQAGSSIMPGKVNPVIPEAINQIAFQVIGNDVTVTFAAEGGQLQLNAFEPVIAKSLFESMTLLTKGCEILAEKCVSGISANAETLQATVANSIGIITALSPRIGYDNATSIAQEALLGGGKVGDIIVARGLMNHDDIVTVLAGNGILI